MVTNWSHTITTCIQVQVQVRKNESLSLLVLINCTIGISILNILITIIIINVFIAIIINNVLIVIIILTIRHVQVREKEGRSTLVLINCTAAMAGEYRMVVVRTLSSNVWIFWYLL